ASGGTGAVPTWVNPGSASTLLSSTNPWTAQQTFNNQVAVSTNLVVNNGGILSGNGSGLTNLSNANLTSGVYGALTGLGAQTQDLNMNTHKISGVSAPAVGTDAANKTYVDVATGSVITGFLAATNTWTAQQTFNS